METPPLRFRVFLSSPGDVTDERGLARQVLQHLPKEPGLHRRVVLEEISWDDPGAPVPLAAHLTPQATIDLRRPKPSECDIVVVILWARMGTPLPEDRRKPDGTPYLSGTEHEFLEAMATARSHGRPTVLAYRRTQVPDIDLADPERDEKIRQYEAVETFFKGFRNTDRSLRYDLPAGSGPRGAGRLVRDGSWNDEPRKPRIQRHSRVFTGHDMPILKRQAAWCSDDIGSIRA